MRVAIIPPTGKTGEWTLNRHLIPGLRAHGVDVKVLHHFALDRPNAKVFLGSLLLKRPTTLIAFSSRAGWRIN
jgi:hypothetical protein